MKEIILSADGDSTVYSVPDVVANDLREYCIDFCDKWLKTSPHAKRYRIKGVYCFNEADFIEYLNEYIFPDQKSVFVKKSRMDRSWGKSPAGVSRTSLL